MKKSILLLMLLASLAFAQQANATLECKRGCCNGLNGTWSASTCKGVANQSFATCSQVCDDFSSGDFCCCASAFVIALIPAVLIIDRKSPEAHQSI